MDDEDLVVRQLQGWSPISDGVWGIGRYTEFVDHHSRMIFWRGTVTHLPLSGRWKAWCPNERNVYQSRGEAMDAVEDWLRRQAAETSQRLCSHLAVTTQVTLR